LGTVEEMRTSARARRIGFVLFAVPGLALIAASVVILIVGPAHRWPVAIVGVLCVAAFELGRVPLAHSPQRTPAASLPIVALPALTPAVPADVAVGIIALGVLLVIFTRTGRIGVAFYGAGLAGASAVVSVLIITAWDSTLPLIVAPSACLGFLVIVLTVESIRLRVTKARGTVARVLALSPVRIAGMAAACVVLSSVASSWSDFGLPFIESNSGPLNAIVVLLALTLIALAGKLVLHNIAMRRRLTGLITGASSLTALSRYARPGAKGEADDAEADIDTEVADILHTAIAEAIGLESVSLLSRPAGRGEIDAPVALGRRVKRFVVVARDPMDVGFTAEDRTALTALAQAATVVVTARRNLGGLTLRADTDPLTGLPNYGAFQKSLAALNESRDYSEALAVLFIDLDDFKRLNDRFGHGIGDRVLGELGRRLRGVVRPDDVVARVGGDEFVIILTHLSSLAEAKSIAERIMAVSGEPLTMNGLTFSPILSIGLAYSAHRESDIQQLVQDADRSMLAIKKSRRRGGPAKESTINISGHRSSQVNDIVARAIDEDRLELAFQPIVSLMSGHIWGFEALVRYTDPELGPISPGSLVEKAKGLGRIDKLTRQVAEKAMAAAAEFRLIDDRIMCMAINVEANQILPYRAGSFLAELAERYPAISLCLELNERSVVRVSSAVREQAEHLRDVGLMIALDDYGSEDSSVDALVRVPMDILKIDRSLVDDLADIRQREVLTALQGFGDSLEYSMIVEGVENELMASRLHEIGIRNAQGFHYGVPQGFEATIARLEQFGATAVVQAKTGTTGVGQRALASPVV
jgi:diguanylate cyclase (GGDEF)-like protein